MDMINTNALKNLYKLSAIRLKAEMEQFGIDKHYDKTIALLSSGQDQEALLSLVQAAADSGKIVLDKRLIMSPLNGMVRELQAVYNQQYSQTLLILK